MSGSDLKKRSCSARPLASRASRESGGRNDWSCQAAHISRPPGSLRTIPLGFESLSEPRSWVVVTSYTGAPQGHGPAQGFSFLPASTRS